MKYIDKYNFWINNPLIDSNTKNELKEYTNLEIKESFYKDISFGTGGLRGIMGAGSNKINIYTIRKVTKGISNYIKLKGLDPIVAISYDNRNNSKKFAYEVASVLEFDNIKTYIYENLRPTPMLSFAVRHFKASMGVMITASHNPKEYNGYKVYNKSGAQLNPVESDEVISEIEKITDPFKIEVSTNRKLVNVIEKDFDEIYYKKVRSLKINETKKQAKIVFSPLHGTGYIIPEFLNKEGNNINPYLKQMTPDGNFSNTKSSNPESKDSFIEPLKYAKEIDADACFLTDPDADRLGIAIKDQNSEYVLLNGNQTASIILYYILKYKVSSKKGIVYTTLVTTNLIKEIAKSYNQKVVTTLTGFKYICEQVLKNEKEYDYTFGCEESYGTLISDFVRDKDAVQAVYLLTEIVNYLKDRKLTVIDFLNEIYEKYGYYYENTESLTFEGIEGLEKIERIMNYYRKNGLKLENRTMLRCDDFNSNKKHSDYEAINTKSNVLKYYYDEDLTVILRPSGTEPKIKIYYALKTTRNLRLDASNIVNEIHKNIIKKINNI